jgi:uncharacterized DUF497 family protein
MKYTWNESKNQINCEKHGLNFEDAELIFSNQTITFEDDREDYGETRFITLGELKNRVVVIVHTQRDLVTRIISMRKANEREKKIYFKRLKEIR